MGGEARKERGEGIGGLKRFYLGSKGDVERLLRKQQNY